MDVDVDVVWRKIQFEMKKKSFKFKFGHFKKPILEWKQQIRATGPVP